MSFKDIFKNSFLNGFTNGVDIRTVVISLIVTTVLAVYIFFVYRAITRKTFYSKTFNLSLIAMAIITSAIILTIQSNIVLSLGMVGALSIVRFRTAIKDPLDLVFLYWSISIGIICGAGLSIIAFVLSLMISVVVILLQKYPTKKISMILVVNSINLDNDEEILKVIEEYCKSYRLKTKSISGDKLDLIVEIKIEEENKLVKRLFDIDGVKNASIMTYDGEITA